MVVMRPLHVSVVSALGSGPTTSVKLRKPMIGTATVHSALVPGQSLEQLQLHVLPSLVPIMISSTPVGHALGVACATLSARPSALCEDLWASEWLAPKCRQPMWDWAWMRASTAQSPQSPRAETSHRR